MLDDLLEKLKALETDGFRVPIEVDERGYVERQCPATDCLFIFKVNQEDWKALFRDEKVTCPQCGEAGPADKWWTVEQIAHGKAEAVNWLKGEVHDGLEDWARGFNRSVAGHGLIRMTARVDGRPPRRGVLPAPARLALERELKCSRCGARYCVIGPSFFCPCCGSGDVDRGFGPGVQGVLGRLDALPAAGDAVSAVFGPGAGGEFCRRNREALIVDCVTIHQVHCEVQYARVSGDAGAPLNAFQRLADGSALFEAATGSGFGDWLSVDEMSRMEVFFQRRHVLAHRSGLVDERYIERSGDNTYEVGDRIIVTDDDVRELARLVRIVGQHASSLESANPAAG